MIQRLTACFVLLACSSVWSQTAEQKPLAASSASSAQAVQAGIAVEFSIAPVGSGAEGRKALSAGDDALFHFRLYDTATHTPITAARPAAWMDATERALGPKSCSERVSQYLGGGMFLQPELDLNSYLVVALDSDASVSIFDPQFGSGKPRTIARIPLKSPGADWALTEDQKLLFVSMPDSGSVAVIDTELWKVTRNIEIGGRPLRLALRPKSQYLWVGGQKDVVAIALDKLQVAARIPANDVRDLVLSSDGRILFAASSKAGTVLIVDADKLVKLRDVVVGGSPIAIDYSASAGRALVADGKSGNIFVLSRSSLRPIAVIHAEPGLTAVRFAPEGRYALALNALQDRIYVIDSSVNQIVQRARSNHAPQSVAFSSHNAYVQHRGSDIVLIVPLDKIGGQGKPLSTVDLPAGQHPISETNVVTLADAVAPATEGDSVLLANAGDRSVYLYKEGMAAPMGVFNDAQKPRAVIVLDRSLKASQPGEFQTIARLMRPGAYTVAFFVDSPRLLQCFNVNVAPGSGVAEAGEHRPTLVEVVSSPAQVLPGVSFPIRLQLRNPVTRELEKDVADVRVLVAAAGGNWYSRRVAQARPDGYYEVDFTLPEPGHYYLTVESQSLGLNLYESTRVALEAAVPEAAPASR